MGKRGPNASKEKPWADALRLAINRPVDDAAPDRKWLNDIAEACVKAAAGGDMQAVREIGDRLDGKAIQQQDVNLNGALAVSFKTVYEKPGD